MTTTGTPDPKNTSMKKWMIAGVVSMLLLAATSAIDASFLYLFLGAASFCFFMALRGWISTKPWRNQNTGYQQQQRPKQDFGVDFNFKATSDKGQQQHQQHHQRTQPSAPPDSKVVAKRIFMVFAAIFAFVFGLVIFVSIFGEEGS